MYISNYHDDFLLDELAYSIRPQDQQAYSLRQRTKQRLCMYTQQIPRPCIQHYGKHQPLPQSTLTSYCTGAVTRRKNGNTASIDQVHIDPIHACFKKCSYALQKKKKKLSSVVGSCSYYNLILSFMFHSSLLINKCLQTINGTICYSLFFFYYFKE